MLILPDDAKPFDKDEIKKIMFKEIEVTQEIIKRMASNSFVIKGWTITLVVITMILSGIMVNLTLALFPAIVFWGLDAYYLHQERLFRKLYDWIIENRMKSESFLLDMHTERFRKEVSFVKTVLSRTIAPFYGLIIGLIILFAVAFTLL